MPREKTIKEILSIRQKFNQLIVGRQPGEVYRMIASELTEEPTTIAQKVGLYGAYRYCKKDIERKER